MIDLIITELKRKLNRGKQFSFLDLKNHCGFSRVTFIYRKIDLNGSMEVDCTGMDLVAVILFCDSESVLRIDCFQHRILCYQLADPEFDFDEIVHDFQCCLDQYSSNFRWDFGLKLGNIRRMAYNFNK